MDTASKDSDDDNTCVAIFKVIWPFLYCIILLITYIGAIIQAVFWSLILIGVLVVAIGLSYRIHEVTGYFDEFTGLGIGGRLSGEADVRIFLIVLILVLFIAGPLIFSVNLCKGLSKDKPPLIWSYIVAGGTCLGIRVWNMSSYEWHDPEDKTALYCGLYFVYLLLLIVTCVEIERVKRAERRNAAILADRRALVTHIPSDGVPTNHYQIV